MPEDIDVAFVGYLLENRGYITNARDLASWDDEHIGLALWNHPLLDSDLLWYGANRLLWHGTVLNEPPMPKPGECFFVSNLTREKNSMLLWLTKAHLCDLPAMKVQE